MISFILFAIGIVLLADGYFIYDKYTDLYGNFDLKDIRKIKNSNAQMTIGILAIFIAILISFNIF